MLYPSSDIKRFLNELGIRPNDVIFVHGDASVAAQFIFNDTNDVVQCFFLKLLEYMQQGTVIVPSFTYSATQDEIFDVMLSTSKVGLFSEKFRLMPQAKRSKHPIFSVSCIGKESSRYINARLDSCFGKDTIFDLMFQDNVKIITLGCEFERGATFLHYVEELLGVPYRYLKIFHASVIDEGICEDFDVSYFVRNLEVNAKLNLAPLEIEALRLNKLKVKSFGRVKARSISARDFFVVAEKLLRANKYALVNINDM